MQLQWSASPCSYLRCSVRQVQNQEQTLEIRLTDGMPDIGRVLCAWGQMMLRGKQWRSDGMQVSGGINAWVLYAPEDGSEPRCVEGWIPFQAKWSFPESHREGIIRTDGCIRSMDARTLSARKLMVRASVALMGEALEPEEASVYSPDELPDGVYVNKKTYPLQLPREAGEKLFNLDDSLLIEGQIPQKMICCRLTPCVTERAALGDKVVMRGNLRADYVYMGEDAILYSGSQELPFAQFADLDREYDKDATASVTMAISNAECTLEGNQLQIKCGLIGQYLIHDRALVELAEDAYSPHRSLTTMMEELELPVQLDSLSQTLDTQAELQAPVQSVVDVTFRPDWPVQYREADRVTLELPGMFQVLYYDADGNLQSASESWSDRQEIAAGEGSNLHISMCQSQAATATVMGDRLHFDSTLDLDMKTTAMTRIPMVTGLEVGEAVVPDPMRPSVILRKTGDMSLWELAKHCGSTVEAIQTANQLADAPAPDRMLLIPVL